MPGKQQRPRPSTAGAKGDDQHPTVARDLSDQVRELARRDDWREAVDALQLSERDARALRVLIIRRRWFGGGTRRP